MFPDHIIAVYSIKHPIDQLATEHLAVAGKGDFSIRIYDMLSKRLLKILGMRHTDRVTCFAEKGI